MTNPLMGQAVTWIEDGTTATVVACVDEKVGLYQLQADDGELWCGFDDQFWLVDS